MGWWQIDPATGMPLRDSFSKLSRPPGFNLLNAVPGVDDEEAAHYLGDSPWDMAYSAVSGIKELLGQRQSPTAEEARALFLNRIIPPSLAKLPPEMTAQLLELVDSMWKSVDLCYEDDWGRPARPAEKKWVGKYAVDRLVGAEPGATDEPRG
jgi:hypothetical protein